MPGHQFPTPPVDALPLQRKSLSFHGIRNTRVLAGQREWGPRAAPGAWSDYVRHGTCFLVHPEDASPKGGAENEETAA